MNVLVAVGDTLRVIDNSNRRSITITSAAELLESIHLPGTVRSAALLDDESLLLHTGSTGAQGESMLHRIRNGALVNSFAKPNPKRIGEDQWVVAASSDGGFWTGSGWDYQIRHWPSAASHDLELQHHRSMGWFPPDQVIQDDMYTGSPPIAWLTHIWEDADGLLWTFTIIPNEDWEPGPSGPPGPEWATKTLDTMIEVIDVETLSLLAQERHDQVLAPVCGKNLVYTIVDTDTGNTQVSVLEPKLLGR